MENIYGYNYYAVVGLNGVAVMDTYEGANKLKKYIKGAEINGYRDFELAEFWALARFRDLSPYGHLLSYLVPNHALFNKNLMSGRF